MVEGWVPLNGALRAGGDRLAEGGELQLGGTPAGADVGRGRRDHGACGGTGLERRGEDSATRIGLDVTSFQKRHEYVTVVTDLDGSRVLWVLDGRTKESVNEHFSAQTAHERGTVEIVAMDMWRPYMDATARWLPNAAVRFDRFHVAKQLEAGGEHSA